ncbi:MAG: hypothetical protein EBT19_02490 [Methylocystaceae bacterium]|nr:hypothetical protein [Methylocystaceae bacterium]NBV94270.1 hypothetical protein [Methylocystaceae bacterium]
MSPILFTLIAQIEASILNQLIISLKVKSVSILGEQSERCYWFLGAEVRDGCISEFQASLTVTSPWGWLAEATIM